MNRSISIAAAAALATLASTIAWASGKHAGDHGRDDAIGTSGIASKATRTVDIAGMRGAVTVATAADKPPPAADAELTVGEVRKIDKASKKLTLKHGPLKNLDMPGMTMVFQVKDDAMLETIQAGDKIRFQAEKIDGKFTVTKIEAAARQATVLP